MTRSRGGQVTGAGAAQDADACTSVSLLFLRWQETGRETEFEAIVAEVRPQVEQVAERVLHRQGLRDPAAVDDAVSLVLDHLRRLCDAEGRDRPVAKFAPIAGGGCHEPRDPGRTFVACLAKDRARDVVRARRRQRSVPFSQLGAEATRAFEQRLVASDPAADGPPLIDRVRAAAERLEPRQRLLVELLLEGKNQAMIAHVLGVCEGTVSRLRIRAIAALQSLVAE
jgi:RNA polymerase sigma factor (sigma-70 family)